MNNRRPLFRRAYRGGKEKIILILIEDVGAGVLDRPNGMRNSELIPNGMRNA